MGGNGMQTLLKEKTAKRSAMAVYYETNCSEVKKMAGVALHTCYEIFRLLIQTDCQTFPSLTVHIDLLYPIFWGLQAPKSKFFAKLFDSLGCL
jgi:hypothetical protein